MSGTEMAAGHDRATGRDPARYARARQIGRYTFVCAGASAFFALPLLWLAVRAVRRAPRRHRVAAASFTLRQLPGAAGQPVRAALAGQLGAAWPAARRSLVVAFAALAAYALSRVRIPGRDALLYGLLLLSVDRHRYRGDGAAVPAGLPAPPDRLPARRDPDPHRRAAAGRDLHPQGLHGRDPRARTRSRRGCSAPRRCRSCGTSWCRWSGRAWPPIAVWAVAQVWGNFLVPFLLLREPGQAAGRGAHVHLLHRGRPAEPRAASPPSPCSTRYRWC